ncbi:MAG: hypothetical protein NTW46_01120 [Candidatus Nealsonbacteria bacterium]|nr:hypothetical protein [Candidatus Nealsonbacteria bacterium]
MPKKIFDIIPPDHKKEAKTVKKDIFEEKQVLIHKTVKNPDLIKEIAGQMEKKEAELKQSEKNAKPTAFKKAFKGFLFVCLLALVIGFVWIVSESLAGIKVKIKIWPTTESLNLTKDLTASLSQNEIDYENGILPGQTVNDSKSLTEEFQATGKKIKEEKAKGIIHVYNSFSDASQPLVLGTRFVSADGKLFKTTSKQTIPGGTYKGGKLVAGEIDISVEAAEVGEAYNIGPTTFSIPGFAGTSKYTAFYGKSFSAMSGGAKKEVSVVTQDDLDKADASLTDKAKKEGLDSLKASLSGDLILIDGAAVLSIKEKTFSLKAGDEADKFSLKLSVDSTGLAFKKADIESFAESLSSKTISKDNKIQDGSLQIGYAFKSLNYKEIKKPPAEAQKELSGISFSADISVNYYLQIDLNEIKQSLLGKSFEEVKTYLSDNPLKISKVEIAPGIFWRKSVPKIGEKVDIELELSK